MPASLGRLTRCAVLTALALALSVAEGLVPLTVLFPLNGDEGYIRVDCRDAQGRHAYSNAYWLDE